MQDDWGHTIGLKGSGSHSITFDGGTIPAHWAIEGAFMVDMASDDGTEGYRLHGDPALTFDGTNVIAAQAVVLDEPPAARFRPL